MWGAPVPPPAPATPPPALPPPPTTTIGDRILAAGGFDASIAVARAAGLTIYESQEVRAFGRGALIYDASGAFIAALSEAAEGVPTVGSPDFRKEHAAGGMCTGTGSSARVLVRSDGKVYPLRNSYNLRFDVCAGAPFECGAVTETTREALRFTDSLGIARSTTSPATDLVVVTAGPLPNTTLANASNAQDAAGRSVCTVTINSNSPTMRNYLTAPDVLARDQAVGVMMHELGHCFGLGHTDETVTGGAGRLMNANLSPAAGFSADEIAMLRQLHRGGPIAISSCAIDCGRDATYSPAENKCYCNVGKVRMPNMIDCAVTLAACSCRSGQCVEDSGGAPCDRCGTSCETGPACGSTHCRTDEQCCTTGAWAFCAPATSVCCGADACASGVTECCRGNGITADRCIPQFTDCCPGATHGFCNLGTCCGGRGGVRGTCCQEDLYCCERFSSAYCSNDAFCSVE